MGPSLAGSGRMNVNNLYLERLLMWLLNRIWFFKVSKFIVCIKTYALIFRSLLNSLYTSHYFNFFPFLRGLLFRV